MQLSLETPPAVLKDWCNDKLNIIYNLLNADAPRISEVQLSPAR